jgi:hypothetical protein
MVTIKIGGKADVQKLHRLVQQDEILVGYPDGVMHPTFVGHKTTKTGRTSKKKAYSALLSTEQNSDLARKLHFGTASIPARPFLYQAIFSVRGELRKLVRETYAKRIKENREPSGQFSPAGIGAFLVGAVQRFVRSDYYKNTVPNAPMTIRMKGSDTPLIDTGFMVNSTVYVTRSHPPKTTAKKIEVSG